MGRRQSLLISAFCLLVSAFAAAQIFASEAFLLQIPKRGIADQEIGEVRITLGLDLPPAGAQLVVAGTTLNLGDTATVAGDEVTFVEAGGNTVRITYRPLSNFEGDFCDGANAVEKNVQMTFSGAQDVVTYRVSTYVVAAPQFACTKVSKRVGELPANVIPNPDGETPLLDAIFRGRHELDVILVLDRSGSMSEKPPGTIGFSPTKAELLKSTLSTFVAQWAELDAPFEDAGEWPNDRIGVVFFHTDADVKPVAGGDPPAGQLVRRGPLQTLHPWNAVRSTIQGLNPNGDTAIGKGINAATQAWLADPKNDLALVVVTDGEQNQDPMIHLATNGLLELDPPTGVPAALAERFIPMQTVGFGTPDTVDEALLKGMSEQTAGVSFIAVDRETIADSFAFTLVALLKGNTASLALRGTGTTSGEHQVTIDPSAQRAVFSVQWAPPDVDALSMEVFRPGAIDHAIPDSTSHTEQSVLHSFNIKPGDAGTWRVRVRPSPTTTGTPSIPYTVNTFVSERKLDTSITFTTPPARTGDPIGVRAIVAYGGKLLTGLPPGAIRMRVRRPAESLGTNLHLATNTVPVVAGGEPVSPYLAKVKSVVDGSLLQRILPSDLVTIPLVEQPNGLYTATFTDTSVAGTYAFELTLDWDDPRTGRVHREEHLERHVAVKVDPALTDVKRRGDVVIVIPRDRFGNYVGPGYASGFNIKAIDPKETGTYELTAPAGTPIVFDGVTLTEPAAQKSWRVFVDAGTNFPDWSVNGGVERLLSTAWSLEGIAGLHRRQSDDLTQFSLGAKRWFGATFVNFGAGVYDSDAGAHAGVGILRKHLELVWNVHVVDSDHFSTLQLGVRF